MRNRRSETVVACTVVQSAKSILQLKRLTPQNESRLEQIRTAQEHELLAMRVLFVPNEEEFNLEGLDAKSQVALARRLLKTRRKAKQKASIFLQ